MKISRENIDSLNAVLRVELSAADYQEQVEKILANYRKTADMPGFRKGKVPMGVVRKRYAIPVKVEEINKILSEKVSKFIVDEKLDILGNPLPKESAPIDWETQDDFLFEYELGFTPDFEVKLSKRNKMDLYKIKANDATIDSYAEDIAKRYGKMSSPEKVTEKDLVYGTFQELDAEGNAVEGGITNQSSISLDFVKTKKLKTEFIGSEKGAIIVLDPKKAFENEADTASMLNIEKDVLEGLKATFSFTIENISHMEPAELNTDLFDKVYGEGVVKDVKEFRAKIAGEAEKMFVGESDKKFQNDTVEFLLENTKFDLPEDFLKRWIRSVSETPVTMDDVDRDFAGYSKSLRWQIIENKIATENNLSVTKEEALAETKQLITAQMAQYGQMAPEEELIEQYAQQVLANKEEEKNVYDRVFAAKMSAFFKESFKLNEKEVTFDEFIKLAQS